MAGKYNFNLNNPMVFFDLETTGTNIQTDRIVEVCVAKIVPSGEVEIKTRRINPEMPIPQESSDIHGITDEDVADAPNFKSVASSLYLWLEGCDLSGYNIKRFDVPLLVEEFKRAGMEFDLEGRKLVDTQTIFHKKEPRTLTAAYSFFCGKSLDNAHSAEADVLASIEVLQGQLAKYPDLPTTMEELDEYCNQREPNWIDSTGKFKWIGSVPTVGFSKHAGRTLKEIATNEPGFLKWMIKASFPKDATQIAQNALQGKFPPDKEIPRKK